LVSLLGPTYNVARGEFVIRETSREIRPTRKLSGFFVFRGWKRKATEGKSFNTEGTEVGAQRAQRVFCLKVRSRETGDDYFYETAREHGRD
jgi:hypothetical protein